jgi:hypothetical protein
MMTSRALAIAASLAAALVGCSDASGTVSGGQLLLDDTVDAAAPAPATEMCVAPAVDDAAPATFTDVYSQVLNGSAGCTGCHYAANSSANLDMSSQDSAYANLFSRPPTSASPCNAMEGVKLVEPGSPCNSLLFLKVSLTAPPCGDQMPLGGAPLTSDQIALIGSWINAGAKND